LSNENVNQVSEKERKKEKFYNHNSVDLQSAWCEGCSGMRPSLCVGDAERVENLNSLWFHILTSSVIAVFEEKQFKKESWIWPQEKLDSNQLNV
jgi:hypothetical protein